MKRFLIPILLGAIPLSLLAQSPKASPTPPSPPFLNRAPALSQWLITIKASATANISGSDQSSGDDSDNSGAGTSGSDSQAQAQPSAPPVLTLVTKDKDVVFEIQTTEMGGRFDIWHFGGATAVKAGTGPWNLVPGLGGSFETPDYSKEDFSGLDWLSASNWAGKQDVMGFHCLIFKGKAVTSQTSKQGPGESEEHPQRGEEPVTAYIDDQTRLPIVVVYKVRGDERTLARIYQYRPTPQPLTVPPEILGLLKDYQTSQRAEAVAGPPL